MPSALITRTFTATILLLIGIMCFSLTSAWYLTILLAIITFYTLIVEWPRLLSVRTASFWLVTPLYPLLPFLMLIGMSYAGYRPVIALLFIVVASFDTGAYLGGSCIGTHLIAPTISPKKTVEGVLCGYGTALFVSILGTYLLNVTLPFLPIILLSFILSSLAFAGDLFESWLKRQAHVKDSGTLLPGHGGFLDRFDSILWGTYFVFFIKDYLMYILFF